MKVILISKIANLGGIGEIVVVKNGYGKNFLIPNKKAILYSASNYKLFESKRKEFEEENTKNLSISEKIKEQIIGKDIIIIENASDDGRLYGSVTTSLIASKINEILGQKALSRANIFLIKPIKEIGLYDVRLNLHSDVDAKVRVIVTRSESEIEILLSDQKKKNEVVEEEYVKVEKKKKVLEPQEEKAEEVKSDAKAEKKPAGVSIIPCQIPL
jgi:large subunit ribosomal protein L9